MGIHLGARTTDAFPHVEKDRFGSCAVMSHLFSCSDSVFMCGYIYIMMCLYVYVYTYMIWLYMYMFRAPGSQCHMSNLCFPPVGF